MEQRRPPRGTPVRMGISTSATTVTGLVLLAFLLPSALPRVDASNAATRQEDVNALKHIKYEIKGLKDCPYYASWFGDTVYDVYTQPPRNLAFPYDPASLPLVEGVDAVNGIAPRLKCGGKTSVFNPCGDPDKSKPHYCYTYNSVGYVEDAAVQNDCDKYDAIAPHMPWKGITCAANGQRPDGTREYKITGIEITSNDGTSNGTNPACKLFGPISKYISAVRDLKKLVINGVDMSGHLPEWGRLAKLQTLDLSNNLIGPGPLDLTLLGGTRSPLEVLRLGGNQWTGDMPKIELMNLQVLDLSSRFAEGKAWPIKDYPTEAGNPGDIRWGKLTGELALASSDNSKLPFLGYGELEEINLSGNLLTGALFPLEAHGNGTNTTALEQISGTEFSTRLRFVDLRDNAFTGTAPVAFMMSVLANIANIAMNSAVPPGTSIGKLIPEHNGGGCGETAQRLINCGYSEAIGDRLFALDYSSLYGGVVCRTRLDMTGNGLCLSGGDSSRIGFYATPLLQQVFGSSIATCPGEVVAGISGGPSDENDGKKGGLSATSVAAIAFSAAAVVLVAVIVGALCFLKDPNNHEPWPVRIGGYGRSRMESEEIHEAGLLLSSVDTRRATPAGY